MDSFDQDGSFVEPLRGVETFVTRVEEWECDHNGHWNTRFYGDAFSAASEVASALSGCKSQGGHDAVWHLRFHQELFSGMSVQVRSSRVDCPDQATKGARMLHVLTGNGQLSATAIEQRIEDVGEFPVAHIDDVTLALPRGLAQHETDWSAVDQRPQAHVILGLLKPNDLEEGGRISLLNMLRFCGRGTQNHREVLGFGSTYTREHKVGRMLVEMRATLFGGVTPGELLTMRSSLAAVHAKSFVSAHILSCQSGQQVARIELSLLAVDMVSRKATSVPSFLNQHI